MPDFYTCDPYAERFQHTSFEDAVDAYLYDFDDMPPTVEVFKFTPMTIDDRKRKRLADSIIESLIESLDDDYGNFDNSTNITPTMRAAADIFVSAVLAEYHVFSCEEVENDEWPKTVDIAQYIAARERRNRHTEVSK